MIFRCLTSALVASCFATIASAQSAPQKLDSVVITASRAPQSPDQVAFSVTTLDADSIRTNPAIMLDGALRSVPGFSLFRRNDSLTGNPTTQGVSLRGLGPSGASRSLVVLDGVPLNDPFGGWIAWTKIPRDGLARAELVPGGGATAWGNAALGGVVQLFTEPITGAQTMATAAAGQYGTHSFEFSAAQPVGGGSLQLLGRAFETDGFTLTAPERRGPVDIDAWNRHRWLEGRFAHPLGANLQISATARYYEEYRDNGTPYVVNNSREKFASVGLAGQPSANFVWDAVGYAQDQTFAATFSSVNATRTIETPASNQYAVPAKAAGFAWTGTWKHAGGARTSGGGDWRTVRGETREFFTFAAGNFTRQRIAGGDQAVGGLFFLHERELAPHLRATLGGRFDQWRDTAGHRKETDRATGAILRDDHYADRDGTEFNPSAGLVWAPSKSWRVRANAQQAFRRPTLNEIYRPFRAGANVTEANADLRTEQVTSGELGAEWKVFNAAATGTTAPVLTLGATAFWNDLRDAVGNVTIARGPGTFPIVGVIAAGGLGRQRLNIDRIEVNGVELAGTWRLTPALSVIAAYQYDNAKVTKARVAPALVGNRVAQVPRYNTSVSAAWRGPHGITVTPRVRWMGPQFEDDENLLNLGEVVVVDVGVSYPLTRRIDLFLNAENLGEARIETGRSVDGIVNVGTPRLILGGLRGKW